MRTVEILHSAKRIVVKVGSSSITGDNEPHLALIVDFAVELKKLGKEVVIVSSGAIATAAPLMGLTVRSDDLPTSQALASIGQAKLMGRYEAALSKHDLLPGQILLTVENLDQEKSSINALKAIERLLEVGVVPVINENDSVATHEIRFGDNDQLAARVAALTSSDLMVLLSDIDGLYTKPPQEQGAEHVAVVKFGDPLNSIEVSGTSTGYGTGGALTKLAAARLATSDGVGVMLTATANVTELLAGDCKFTWFEPNTRD